MYYLFYTTLYDLVVIHTSPTMTDHSQTYLIPDVPLALVVGHPTQYSKADHKTSPSKIECQVMDRYLARVESLGHAYFNVQFTEQEAFEVIPDQALGYISDFKKINVNETEVMLTGDIHVFEHSLFELLNKDPVNSVRLLCIVDDHRTITDLLDFNVITE